ncbi:uncharacterized protein TEOVI_000023700 [Trypanosoma equiperdum]|uniref:Uncharacterized protein n=1 Tax=Trypanosoma equiperdum TaxID=5694 RepID=A0A1G4I2I9_TRYEQ|nr:hypothetical protein, conserved [Trypanosoma equiperdum]
MTGTTENHDEQHPLTCFETISQIPTQMGGSTRHTASTDSEDGGSPLIYFAQPNVKDGVKRLMDIAVEFNGLLTDSSEKLLRLRRSLNSTLEILNTSMKGLKEMRRPSGCLPSMVVAGATESGKSTVADFLLRCATCSFSDDSPMTKNDDSPAVNTCGTVSSPYTSMSLQECSFRKGSCACSTTNISDANAAQNSRARAASTKPCRVSMDPRTERSCMASPRILYSPGRCTIPSAASSFRVVPRDPEIGAPQCQTPSVLPSLWTQERALRRFEYPEDDSKSGTLSRVVNFSHLSSSRGRRQREGDTLSTYQAPTPVRVSTIRPGAYDVTIQERICALQKSPRKSLIRDKPSPQRRCTLPMCPSKSWCSSEKLYASSIHSSQSGVSRSSPWLLKELASEVVWSERGAMSSYQLPDLLLGDGLLYTVPCEVIGTQHMVESVGNLFSPFTQRIDDDNSSEMLSSSFSSSRAVSKHETHPTRENQWQSMEGSSKESESQKIRQLIADMTFFVITFTDAVLMREAGASINDVQLIQRPPPMASSIPELIELFQENMMKLFGVAVSSWQVIPYSGTVSHATHSVLSALYNDKLRRLSLAAAEEKQETPARNSQNRERVPSLSPSALTESDAGVGGGGVSRSNDRSCEEESARTAVEAYCRVVFGANYGNRKEQLPPQQLEQLVLYDAVNSMWNKSGAQQLLRAVRVFEKNTELSVFTRVAVSLVIWCHQLRTVLVRARKSATRRSRSIRMNLTKVQNLDNVVREALGGFKEIPVPRVVVRDFETVVQRKFKSVTVAFWGKVLDLLDEAYEDMNDDHLTKRRPVVRRCPLPSGPSDVSLAVRKRLLTEFRDLHRHFISLDYRKQIQQLRAIIAEQAMRIRNVAAAKTKETVGARLEGADAVVLELVAETRRETIGGFAATKVSATAEDMRHHIPYVEDNARELKVIMERELTLRLSRFNTEIINYLMQELSEAIPDIAQVCGAQRDVMDLKLVQLFALLKMHECSDRINWNALDSKREQLANCSLLNMQPLGSLEPFVTGLRTSVVEDQIMLMLVGEGFFGTDEVKCGGRTLSYLGKCENRICALQRRDLRLAMNLSCGRPLQSHFQNDDLLYTPAKPEDLISSLGCWTDNITNVPHDEATSVSTAISEVTSFSDGSCDAPGNESAKQNRLESDCRWSSTHPSLNPLWFILAVWQQTLSSMTFRPWFQLDGVNHATLLSSVGTLFTSSCEGLRAQLRGEVRHLEDALRVEHREKSRVESRILKALRRLSTNAVSVANDFTRLRKGVFVSDEACKVRESSFSDPAKYV